MVESPSSASSRPRDPPKREAAVPMAARGRRRAPRRSEETKGMRHTSASPCANNKCTHVNILNKHVCKYHLCTHVNVYTYICNVSLYLINLIIGPVVFCMACSLQVLFDSASLSLLWADPGRQLSLWPRRVLWPSGSISRATKRTTRQKPKGKGLVTYFWFAPGW